MIKGVQTIDKRPLLTIEDMQNYVLGLEIENKDLQQQLDKYKNVIDKIKEYVKENIRYYDNELGLVEIMGAGATRIPVLYLYGLLELLEEVE